MSDQLSAKQLDQIRERANAATNGPWANYGDIRHEVYPVLTGDEENEVDNVSNDVPRLADSVFIAAAREDIPALLAHIDAQTEKLWLVVATRNAALNRAEAAEQAIQRVRDLLIPNFYDRAEANQLLNKIQAALDGAGA